VTSRALGEEILEFWASSEAHRPAGLKSEKVRRNVEPFLNKAFAASSLATLKCKLRYVPIIMPAEARERYPARSKLRRKERIYDCAPQLDFQVFVDGTFEDQLREYLKGISESGPHLAELGASAQQIEDFNRIIETSVERILLERPDQTRH